MKIGIICGNRLFPILLLKNIRSKEKECEIIAIGFKKETSPLISKYADRVYWIDVGKLKCLIEIIRKESLKECIMAGQISPLRIFDRRSWDDTLVSLVERVGDFRPHSIFVAIIKFLEEEEKVKFLDSTLYLKEYLATGGLMNSLELNHWVKKDIEFGLSLISHFVNLDIGQTMIVKKRSVVALEALEGTDNTILRAYRLAGKGITVLKFSKHNQDLRFDIPVVGINTLKLLRKVKAASLVLEKDKVLILEKEKFVSLAKTWGIPVIGEIKKEV